VDLGHGSGVPETGFRFDTFGDQVFLRPPGDTSPIAL